MQMEMRSHQPTEPEEIEIQAEEVENMKDLTEMMVLEEVEGEIERVEMLLVKALNTEERTKVK